MLETLCVIKLVLPSTALTMLLKLKKMDFFINLTGTNYMNNLHKINFQKPLTSYCAISPTQLPACT